jgi:hypothetical protein
MGGAGPYVEFNPSYRSSSLADHTGLCDLSEDELEAAYARAGSFLREKGNELVDGHQWSAQSEPDTVSRSMCNIADKD